MNVERVRVNANNLSPMKMAESYWCLFRASWRQSLKNVSIAGEVASAEQPQVHELDSIEGESQELQLRDFGFCWRPDVCLRLQVWKSRDALGKSQPRTKLCTALV